MSEKLLLLCSECKADPKIVRPRDVDVTCEHCGLGLCGGHILSHLRKVHCVFVEVETIGDLLDRRTE